MTTELDHVKQKSILDLAEHYRQQGYQVFVKVRGSDLHETISNDELDLIVHTEQDAVVVAVRTHAPQSQTHSSHAMTQTELPFKRPQLYDYPVRDTYDIQVYLARVLELIEMGAPDSAIRSTVFTAEAVMRLVAEHHAIDFEPQIPTELAQTFLERGLISQEDYQVLGKAINMRDAMIYKHEKVIVEPEFAYQTVQVVQRLFSQAGQFEDELLGIV